MSRSLRSSPCRAACSWAATGAHLGGEPLFACAGCGSEWVPGQAWLPADRGGEVPAAVRAAAQAARERRDRRGGRWQPGQ